MVVFADGNSWMHFNFFLFLWEFIESDVTGSSSFFFFGSVEAANFSRGFVVL